MLALVPMLSLVLPLALQLAGSTPDTAHFPPKEGLLRLYTNCDESRWPSFRTALSSLAEAEVLRAR